MARVLTNPRLRRVELAFLGFGAAEYGVWVAVLVYAYERGGTGMAAGIAVAQLVPAAVFAPAAARLVDRRGGAAMLRASYLTQSGCLFATGTVFLISATSALGYVCAAVAASAVTLTRPAQAALLPRLVDRPSELTAANAASSWVESVSMLTGPALAGGLIALDGPGLAVGTFALELLLCGGLVSHLGRDHPVELVPAGSAEAPGEAGVLDVLRANSAIPALLGLFVAQFAAEGATDVLVVVLAVKELALGSSGPGYLQAMFGLGAVLGGIGAVSLVGRRTMGPPLLMAAAAWGIAFITLGGWQSAGAAFGLIAAAGASRTVLGAAGRTLLHRAVPAAVHGRIFGLLEGLAMAGLAIGSLSVPGLVSLGGVSAALIAAGGTLMLVTLAVVTAVRRLDDGTAVPEAALVLLRRCAIFAPLGAPVLEDLARAMVWVDVGLGEAVVREGEPGESFYVVAAGVVEVAISGVHVRDLGAGEGFGEIALLRDGVRTATVSALGPAAVYELGRAPFLQALSGCVPAVETAQEVVGERLRAPVARWAPVAR